VISYNSEDSQISSQSLLSCYPERTILSGQACHPVSAEVAFPFQTCPAFLCSIA